MELSDIFSQRLKNARVAKGYSRSRLSDALKNSISAQTIGNYESGKSFPDSETMAELVRVLDTSMDMLFKPFTIDWSAVQFNYRKRKSIAKGLDASISHKIKTLAEKYMEIEDVFCFSARRNDVVEVCRRNEVRTAEDARIVAQCFRRKIGIPSEPIVSIQEILEDNGIKLIPIEATPKFDGVNFNVSNTYFICYNKEGKAGERTRFTLAHELGHLLMTIPEDVDYEERLCDAFAAELLLPGQRLMSMLGSNRHDISTKELKFIQSMYGISVDAIMVTAQALNIITGNRLKTYFVKKKSNKDLEAVIDKCEYSEDWHNRYEALVYRALSSEMISMSKAAYFLDKDTSEVNSSLKLV